MYVVFWIVIYVMYEFNGYSLFRYIGMWLIKCEVEVYKLVKDG